MQGWLTTLGLWLPGGGWSAPERASHDLESFKSEPWKPSLEELIEEENKNLEITAQNDGFLREPGTDANMLAILSNHFRTKSHSREPERLSPSQTVASRNIGQLSGVRIICPLKSWMR